MPSEAQFLTILFFDDHRSDARGGLVVDVFNTHKWELYRVQASEQGETLISPCEGYRQSRIATWKRV